MSKTIRNVFDRKLTYIKLIEAHYRAVLGKKKKREVLLFEEDLETNVYNLLYKLERGIYKLGKYREFKVYEPKERTIKSLPYKDRVVHQWYVEEFIKPFYVPRFIRDTYACIDNRGSHVCSKKCQEYMLKMKKRYGNYYVLKGDIQKYFYSIRKDILFDLLSRDIKDVKLLDLTRKLIYDNEEIVGIPIGNYTSQYFANIYLSELDYYVKYELKVTYYLRYMDDFVILLPSKEECKEVLYKIRLFLERRLDLKLNTKTRYYPSKFGVNFCGYIIHERYLLLRKRCVKKIKKRLRKNRLCLKDFHGHLMHANCYHFVEKIKEELLRKNAANVKNSR